MPPDPELRAERLRRSRGLSSVLERTREIGVRLAVGATPADIRLLFIPAQRATRQPPASALRATG